jgi:hypothetical protein
VMKITVEIFSNGSRLHSISHEVHSLEAVKAAAQSLVDAAELPAQSYRLLAEDGRELLPSNTLQNGRVHS